MRAHLLFSALAKSRRLEVKATAEKYCAGGSDQRIQPHARREAAGQSDSPTAEKQLASAVDSHSTQPNARREAVRQSDSLTAENAPQAH